MAALLGVALTLFSIAATVASAATKPLYSSQPVAGTVSVPSVGVEAYSFNKIGNEVILRRSGPVRSVNVTMVSWACQHGDWTGNSGTCTTTPEATFPVPITLTLYRASHTDPDTGETIPGTKIKRVTKTFNIRYRPSSTPAQCGGDVTEYLGSDGVCHHGKDQTIIFPILRSLPQVVVWGVSYNSDNSGPHPLGGSNAPTDSLNVGLSPSVQFGHDRYADSIFWDTRFQGFTCAAPAPDGNGGPFVTGVFNQDGPCDGKNNSWAGSHPAAKFVRG